MELFGIALSVPVGFALSLGYCAFLAKFVRRFEPWRRWLFASSLAVLSLFAVELALLVTVGAKGGQRLLGPAFYGGHLALFVLGTPALANVLVLPLRGPVLGKWLVAVVACTIFALLLVLLQYSVSETLFGID